MRLLGLAAFALLLPACAAARETFGEDPSLDDSPKASPSPRLPGPKQWPDAGGDGGSVDLSDWRNMDAQ